MYLFDYQAILPLCKAWVNDWINDLNLIVAMVNFIIQTLASCFSGLAWTAFPVAVVSFIGTVIALIVKKKKPGKNELIDVLISLVTIGFAGIITFKNDKATCTSKWLVASLSAYGVYA